jgi:hypothetical protein
MACLVHTDGARGTLRAKDSPGGWVMDLIPPH